MIVNNVANQSQQQKELMINGGLIAKAAHWLQLQQGVKSRRPLLGERHECEDSDQRVNLLPRRFFRLPNLHAASLG